MPVTRAVGIETVSEGLERRKRRRRAWARKRGARLAAPLDRVGRSGAQTGCAPRGARLTFPAARQRVQTFTLMILSPSATRTTCRFGFQVRRVLTFECETAFPKATPLSQT